MALDFPNAPTVSQIYSGFVWDGEKWTLPVASGSSITPSNSNPLMDATAAPGVLTLYSRGDHVHPSDTSRAPLASPTFTGVSTFTGQIVGNASGGGIVSAFFASSPLPTYGWRNTSAGVDQKLWDAYASTTTLEFRALNDASNTANNWMTVTRGAGATVSGVSIPSLQFLQAGTGAVTRPMQDKAREIVSVTDFVGADITGTNPSDTAITAALASHHHIHFPQGTYRIAASAAWDYWKTCSFAPFAKLVVDAGVTLTIRGEVVIPHELQVFAGAGSVVGVRRVKPEWFGALGDGSNDDQAALQRAHNCVEQSQSSKGGEQVILLGGGRNYAIGSTWTLRPTCNNNIRVRGAGVIFGGSRITAKASFSGGAAVVVAAATGGGVNPIADWGLFDFAIIATAGTTTTVGLYIGSTNAAESLSGVQPNQVSNIYTEGFKFSLQIQGNVRLIHFQRCGLWGGSMSGASGVVIYNSQSGTFTGDMTFAQCQFVLPIGGGTRCVDYYTGNSGASITGIRYTECIFYHGDTGFYALIEAGGNSADHWFTNCQFDGTARAFEINVVNSGSYLHNYYIQTNYFQGHGNKGVTITSSSSGYVKDISFTGNRVNGVTNSAMEFSTVDNVMIASNIFNAIDSSGGSACNFFNCKTCVFSGNILGRAPVTAGGGLPAQCQYFVNISGNTDYHITTGNIAYNGATTGFLLNTSTGAHNHQSNDFYN